MGSYDNRFGNYTIGVTNFSYTALALVAGNSPLQLYWSDQFVDTTNTVSSWIDVTADAAGRAIKMPDARQTSPGQQIDFNNWGANDVTLYAQDGTTTITTLQATKWVRVVLIDNSTANGTWRAAPLTPLGTAVTSITQTSSTPNIVIAPSGAQSAAVSYTFNVGADLNSTNGLTSFAANTGIAVRTATNTWALRTITGAANQIAIAQGSGALGNPVISLAANISGVTSITVGNINIGANNISAVNANGDINLVPQAAGSTTFATHAKLLQGAHLYFRNPANTADTILKAGAQVIDITYTWPTVPALAGQALVSDLSGNLSWATVSTSTGGSTTTHAIARYFDASGTLENSGVLLDDSNNVTGMNSLIVGGALQLGISGATNISTLTGNLLLSPNGLSEVYSNNNLNIRSASMLKLSNTLNTNFISVAAHDALTVTYDLVLPSFAPLLSQMPIVTEVGTTPLKNTLIWRDSIPGQNILINGAMDIWQRNINFVPGTPFFPNNDGVVTADRWKLLSDGNDIVSVTRGGSMNISAYGSSQYSLLATVTAAGVGKKFGFTQILEAADTYKLLTHPLSFGLVLAGTGITSVRVTILSWTGTADSPTGDFVSAWNGFGVAPTYIASWNQVLTQLFTINSTPTLYRLNNFVISTPGANNCAVFFSIENTTVLGNTLQASLVKLEEGQYLTTYPLRTFAQELALSKRFFNKDFPHGTPVGTLNTAQTSSNHIQADPIPNNVFYAEEEFEVEMLKTPVFKAYSVTAGTTDMWSKWDGTDYPANSAQPSADSKTYKIYNNGAGPLTVTNGFITGHWYAEAEF